MQYSLFSSNSMYQTVLFLCGFISNDNMSHSVQNFDIFTRVVQTLVVKFTISDE